MATLKTLEKEIRDIKERNRRVEAEKDWETSGTRRVLVGLFTYLSVALYLFAIRVEPAWLHAIVPTIGFLLSTLTLPSVRKMWLSRRSPGGK